MYAKNSVFVIFVIKRSYSFHYIICITVPLTSQNVEFLRKGHTFFKNLTYFHIILRFLEARKTFMKSKYVFALCL